MAEEKPKVGKPEKFITIVINGKEKKIRAQSQYILNMLIVEDN